MSEDVSRQTFLRHLKQFLQAQGITLEKSPVVGRKPVDLYILYKEVTALGGLAAVREKRAWAAVVKKLELPPSCTSASTTLTKVYRALLEDYERKYFQPTLRPLGRQPEAVVAAAAAAAAPATEQRREQQPKQLQHQHGDDLIGAMQIRKPRRHSARGRGGYHRNPPIHVLLPASFQRVPIAPVSTRSAARLPAEVTTRRILGCLSSGIDAHVGWATEALLAKSFSGELFLEHAPGLAAAIIDVFDAARVGTSEQDQMKDRVLGEALGVVDRPRALMTALHNLAQVRQNAVELGASRRVVESLAREVGAAFGAVDPDSEIWRLALDTVAHIAPFVPLWEHERGGRCTGLLACLTSHLQSAEEGVAASALRSLATFASNVANDGLFASLDAARLCDRAVELLTFGGEQTRDSAIRLIYHLCRPSLANKDAVLRHPAVFRRLISVLSDSASSYQVVSAAPNSELAAETLDRGRYAANLIWLLASDGKAPSLVTYEPYLASLSASASGPFAAFAAQLLAQVTRPPTVEPGSE